MNLLALTMYEGGLIGGVVFLMYAIGIVGAVYAVLASRTPQGSIAWAVSLVSIPFITVPIFLVLGRSKFNGKVNARRANDKRLASLFESIAHHGDEYRVDLENEFGNARVLNELTHLPFIRGNDTQLLVDGEATFKAMFDAIDQAEKYVIAEFYIVKDDELGTRFQERLIVAAQRGCVVYLLFDEVGSSKLSRSSIAKMREAGVNVSGVKTTRGWTNRFQLNFRNHRKIVVIDGKFGLIGGHNVGDDYVSKDKRLTPWRDTHMLIEGPAILPAQLAFVEDWLWATDEIPELDWTPVPSKNADRTMFVLPSGPDDDYETCGLFFTHLINCATERLWIATPYFVPDEGIVTALQLAAMRGVDVRIIIPGLPDKWIVKRAAMAYVPEVTSAGVKMYEFGKGFNHQKVAIMDDRVSVIGTANFDNRSFRLNFEITAITACEEFQKDVVAMLENDFSNSKMIDPNSKRSLFFRVSSRVARLFAPIL